MNDNFICFNCTVNTVKKSDCDNTICGVIGPTNGQSLSSFIKASRSRRCKQITFGAAVKWKFCLHALPFVDLCV